MSMIESWIALDLLEAIGPRTAHRLLEVYGNPDAIFSAPLSKLRDLGILNKAQLESFSKGPDNKRAKEIITKLESMNAYAICLDDMNYPQMLKETHDPPCVLYVKGSLDEIQPAVAIVGTRSPSHYGKDIAFRFAKDLSKNGLSIISGLARGIDRQAHAGAMEGPGKTVAVLGSGIDVIYPPEHADLSEKIMTMGAVISELPPGTRPDAHNFPRRNRIISGLCLGVIVVEATTKSGALITARYALEQGRQVMAVPGNITNIRSQGPHQLIRQGSAIIQDTDDVLNEIAPQIRGMLNNLKPEISRADDILNMVNVSPLSIDEIAAQLDIDIVEASRRVSMLELQGTIERIEGNRYAARSMNG